MDYTWTKLSAELTPEVWERTRTLFTHAHENNFEKCKQRQREKYDALLTKKNGSTEAGRDGTPKVDTTKWVKNLSDRQLEPSEHSVLQKGLNFSVTPPTIPTDEIIASTEAACAQMSNKSDADSFRAEEVKILKTGKPPKVT